MIERRLSISSIIGSIFLSFNILTSADWYTWRGPQANGTSTETDWQYETLSGSAPISWKTSVGNGWSAVSINKGLLYTMGNKAGKDILYCLRENTGEEVWRFSYKCTGGNYPGPRATPVIDGLYVYTISRNGDLYCLNKLDGKLVWRRNIFKDFGAMNLRWGFSSTPVIEGEILLINANNSGLALNINNGELIWNSPPARGSYSVPVIYKSGNESYAAILGEKVAHGVNLSNGEIQWSYQLDSWFVHAADPIIHNDELFFSSDGDGLGTMINITDSIPIVKWTSTELRNNFSSSILHNGYIYGSDGLTGDKTSSLSCIDWETGQLAWKEEIGHNTMILADGKLICLNENGELIIIRADHDKYQELVRRRIFQEIKNNFSWTAPVLANGNLYCRSGAGDLVCIDLSLDQKSGPAR